MSFFSGQAFELISLSISLGVCLFIAGVVMEPRDEEDQRGLLGNFWGGVGVSVGLIVFFLIAQWFPLIQMLRMPVLWCLVIVCFRLSNLYEMVAMCGLSYILTAFFLSVSSNNW